MSFLCLLVWESLRLPVPTLVISFRLLRLPPEGSGKSYFSKEKRIGMQQNTGSTGSLIAQTKSEGLMENAQSLSKSIDLPAAVQRLSVDYGIPFPKSSSNAKSSLLYSLPRSNEAQRRRRSLVSLCLGVLGCHLEDIIMDLDEIALIFSADIKMALLGIARRRRLLGDTVLLALADSSWELLDVSGSDVTDAGMQKVAEMCPHLKAVDISRCNQMTAQSICVLVQSCRSLEILRCGGTSLSNLAARRCLDILKPKLNEVEEDSWEELDSKDIANGAQALRWLIWPSIDEDSMESLTTECPRIIVNPKPSPFGYRGLSVPREAFPDIALDDPAVEDIDPRTWAISAAPRLKTLTTIANSEPDLLPKAERFRLAFVERDERLAPKRAKNTRQHQRRAERELMKSDTSAKSLFLAALAHKSLWK